MSDRTLTISDEATILALDISFVLPLCFVSRVLGFTPMDISGLFWHPSGAQFHSNVF